MSFLGRNPIWPFSAFLFFALLLSAFELFSQNIWQDKNPYSPSSKISVGTILKLKVDEPMSMNYRYNNSQATEAEVELRPSQKITPFLEGVESEHTISRKKSSSLRSQSNLKFKIAVLVQSITGGNTIQFRGTRILAQESGDTRQNIVVTGVVSLEDIGHNRDISSKDISDLTISVQGAPVERQKNIKLDFPKQEQEDESNQARTPPPTAPSTAPATPPAQRTSPPSSATASETPAEQKKNSSPTLSQESKERLLFEYIQRALGETDVP